MLVSTTLHLSIPKTANPETPCPHNNPVLETARVNDAAKSIYLDDVADDNPRLWGAGR